MLRASMVALVGALLALGAASPAGAVTGEQRVLVVLATWGPTPFAVADVRREVFVEADAFLRRASYGRLSLRGDVVGWLPVLDRVPACAEDGLPRAVTVPARAAAAARGFAPGGYDRVVYVVPASRCGFLGLGIGSEAFLNGSFDSELVVHELGHTWGLGHAASAQCADLCSLEEDGDVYSPMGIGFTDFSIFEKVQLGWTRNIAAFAKPARLSLGRADRPDTQPLALRVDTAIGAFWLEYRPQRVDLGVAGALPGGVVVRYVPSGRDDDLMSASSVLISQPARRSRPVATVGETIRIPGIFSARFASQAGGVARLTVRWDDRRAPLPPAFVQPGGFAPVGPNVRVRWEASFERGSGVASYRVAVDGGRPQVVRNEEFVLRGLTAGVHFVSVSAVDRAGNRGLASVRRFEVVR